MDNPPILSQYGITFRAIAKSINDALDPKKDLDAFYDAYQNVHTANLAGLINWGKIVNASRFIPTTPAYVAFNEQIGVYDPFNPLVGFGQGALYNGQILGNSSYALPKEMYRSVILAVAGKNITNGSTKDQNAILMRLFSGRGSIYVSEPSPMTNVINVGFSLTTDEIGMLRYSQVVPKKAGVSTWMQLHSLINYAKFGETGAGIAFDGQGALYNGQDLIRI